MFCGSPKSDYAYKCGLKKTIDCCAEANKNLNAPMPRSPGLLDYETGTALFLQATILKLVLIPMCSSLSLALQIEYRKQASSL